MNKSDLYKEAKRRGVQVKWIGSTKEQLYNLINTKNNEITFVDVIFVVYIQETKIFEYRKTFEVTKNIDELIRDYIIQKNAEYGDYITEEVSRSIRVYDSGIPERDILNTPLWKTGTYNISKYVKNDNWNTTDNECVIDYICDRLYNNTLQRDVIREYLGEINLSEDNQPYYSAANVIQLSERFHINIYITHFNKLIYKALNNEGYRRGKCLCFEIRNNHVYPINDKQRISKLMNSGTISKYDKDKEYKFTCNFGDVIFHPSNKEDNIRFLFDSIKETNYQPYSFIQMKNRSIRSFILNDNLYVCHPKDEKVEQYCKDNKIEYYGQTIQKYVKPYLKEIPISFMNYQVLTALTVSSIKHRVQLGNPYNRESYLDDVAIDINKDYRACIEQPYDNFMVIDFDTIIQRKSYNNDFGLWYVETDDMTLLHGTNWYSNKILDIAIEDNIRFKCTHFIKGITSKFSFINIINKLIDEFKDSSKLAINSIVGFLAQTKEESAFLKVTTDFNDVLYSLKKPNPIVFQQDDLYLFGNSIEYSFHKNYLPMWIQILDWSNIRLHNLIMKHGSYDNLVYRRTDMAIMRNCQVNISNDIGGYKIENKPFKQVSYSSIRYAPLCVINKEYNKITNVMDHLNNKKSLLITGRAGTGKSWYINEFSKTHTTIRLAYTNKAANNINGITLHKFFKIGEDELSNKKKSITADAIFIDEISMIPEFIWSLIIDLKNQCNVPIILVGDHRQLPPVSKVKNSNYFENPTIAWIVDYNRTELMERQRYDEELWNYLETPYALPNSPFDYNAMHICHTNECVNKINTMMNQFHVKEPTIIIDELRLTNGVPLLSIITNKFLIKNELYKIDSCKSEKNNKLIILLSTTNDSHIDITINKEEFSKLFKLGYAMTTHKLQGSTIEGSVQIHEINNVYDSKLFYTAYSRATKLSNITYCIT